MKTKWSPAALIAIALIAVSGCAPNPPRAARLPGQAYDPGRLAEAAAEAEERIGNKQAAKVHRAHAIAQRQECNIFTFLIDLVGNGRTRACF